MKDSGFDITPLPKTYYVHLLVQDSLGLAVALLGGCCPPVADIMRKAVEQFPKHVTPIDSSFASPGQCLYRVSWEYLMTIRGAFSFLLASDVMRMPEMWPDTLIFTVIVTS
jgi:hypothetical protein